MLSLAFFWMIVSSGRVARELSTRSKTCWISHTSSTRPWARGGMRIRAVALQPQRGARGLCRGLRDGLPGAKTCSATLASTMISGPYCREDSLREIGRWPPRRRCATQEDSHCGARVEVEALEARQAAGPTRAELGMSRA